MTSSTLRVSSSCCAGTGCATATEAAGSAEAGACRAARRSASIPSKSQRDLPPRADLTAAPSTLVGEEERTAAGAGGAEGGVGADELGAGGSSERPWREGTAGAAVGSAATGGVAHRELADSLPAAPPRRPPPLLAGPAPIPVPAPAVAGESEAAGTGAGERRERRDGVAIAGVEWCTGSGLRGRVPRTGSRGSGGRKRRDSRNGRRSEGRWWCTRCDEGRWTNRTERTDGVDSKLFVALRPPPLAALEKQLPVRTTAMSKVAAPELKKVRLAFLAPPDPLTVAPPPPFSPPPSLCTARARPSTRRSLAVPREQYMDKNLLVNLQGHRKVSGHLRGFDIFLNLVLDNAKDETSVDKVDCGTVVRRQSGHRVLLRDEARLLMRLQQVIRGNSVTSIEMITGR